MLPMLVPSISIVVVLRTVEAFKVFDIIYAMTGAVPSTAPRPLPITPMYGVLRPELRGGLGTGIPHRVRHPHLDHDLSEAVRRSEMSLI